MRACLGFEKNSPASPYSTTTPLSMKTTQSATSRAKAISCVAMMMVVPPRFKSRISSKTSPTSSWSIALVTSSSKNNLGFNQPHAQSPCAVLDCQIIYLHEITLSAKTIRIRQLVEMSLTASRFLLSIFLAVRLCSRRELRQAPSLSDILLLICLRCVSREFTFCFLILVQPQQFLPSHIEPETKNPPS